MPKIGTGRFRWGISIDDVWKYAGLEQPKSMIIPYVLSLRLPRGPFRIASDVDSEAIRKEMSESDEGGGANFNRKLLCRELASELKNRGIDFVRCWFPWSFFEPIVSTNVGAGVFDFPLDDFVGEMKAGGVEVVAVLANGYSRFLPRGVSTEDPKSYVTRMAAMAEAVVSHYKGSISMWQIENEPNWWEEHYATHWRSGGMWLEPGIRESILETLHASVRSADADAMIMINLEADNRKTDWSFYAKYCDVLGLDFYPNYMHSSPIDTSEFALAKEVKREAGIPVYVAETGYPSGPSFFGYSEANQAAYVESACKEAFGCDAIAGLAMWRYSDSYWSSFPFQENYFGLLRKDGGEKPAWAEYHNQISSNR